MTLKFEEENLFFSSDHHFGHGGNSKKSGILKYTKRPFKTVEEMDSRLIELWNNTVPLSGTVIYLGDFTLGSQKSAAYYLSKLNGNIFILNNFWHHDKRWIDKAEGMRTKTGVVTLLPPSLVVQVANTTIHLSHYPILEWDAFFRGGWHLHGHTHGAKTPNGKALDVGVDTNKLKPLAYCEVYDTMKLKTNPI